MSFSLALQKLWVERPYVFLPSPKCILRLQEMVFVEHDHIFEYKTYKNFHTKYSNKIKQAIVIFLLKIISLIWNLNQQFS